MITNTEIAERLRQHAHVLSRAPGSLYRARAFRQAAMAVLGLDTPVELIVTEGGPESLRRIPGIGDSLAETIATYATRGEWHVRTAVGRN
jgi:DNA polymerase (family 10)